MQTEQHERILGALEQSERPVSLEALASRTSVPVEKLKSYMGELASNGEVQKIGTNHYRFAGFPVPKEGEAFTGTVTGTSIRGGAILRDQSGTSWRVEPV